jgi:hypothetical protein
MNALARALDARWFLLVITVGLVFLTGAMYWRRSALETMPDLERSTRAQSTLRSVLAGKGGDQVAAALASSDRAQVAVAEAVSSMREVLFWASFLGVLGCTVNLVPPLRRRVLPAVHPGDPDKTEPGR